MIVLRIIVVAGMLLAPLATGAAPPGWRLVWGDDFDALDEELWEVTTSASPADGGRQAYLPEQVTAGDGKLVILSENTPAGELPFRSGQVVSKRAQRYGRWEVRARIATTRGVWSSIWLRPDRLWAAPPFGQYKVAILENRGERPTITRSGCYWGGATESAAGRLLFAQRTSRSGKLVSYADGFHVYAGEWFGDQLRFYVDDVYHAVLYSDEVGDFLSRELPPMRLVIGTAIGGDGLPEPDDSTTWPQRLVVDWVRVYERIEEAETREFTNGSFEAGGGSLAGWHVFGNRLTGDANVAAQSEAASDGKVSLKLAGQSVDGANYSGVTQGVSVTAGQRVRATLYVMSPATGGIAKTANTAAMKIEFYNRFGDYFGGPAMLGFEERVIADGSTPTDQWRRHKLTARVPEGAVEARLAIVFGQAANESGAVHIDAAEFSRVDE